MNVDGITSLPAAAKGKKHALTGYEKRCTILPASAKTDEAANG
jgi:hypothetical protein